MVATVRLMPRHDPHWREKLEPLRRRHVALLSRDGLLSRAEQDELCFLRRAMDQVLISRFRTTAEYRDFHMPQIRQVLEDEGIHMTLPPLPDDSTLEEIDQVLDQLRQAVDCRHAGGG